MKHLIKRIPIVLAGFILLTSSFAMATAKAVTPSTEQTATFDNLTDSSGNPLGPFDPIDDGTVVTGLKFETNDDVGMLYDIGNGADGSDALANDWLNTPVLVWIEFTKADNSDFSFVSVWLDNYGATSCTVTGYLDGSPVSGCNEIVSLVGGGSVHTFNWPRVDAVRFTASSALDINIDNFIYDLPVNHAPTIQLSTASSSFTEDSASVPIDSSAVVNDADGDSDWNGGSLKVQITNNATSSDRITIPDDVTCINTSGTAIRNGTTVIGMLSAFEGTVTGSTKLTIVFNSNATNTLVQSVMRSIHFDNTSQDPSTLTRTITATVTDVNSASSNDTRTMEVYKSDNDAPTMTLNNGLMLTNGQTKTITDDDVYTTTDSNGLIAEDVDDIADNLTYTVTIAPSHGYLQKTSNPSVSVSTFTQTEINNDVIQYVHDNSTAASDSFVFKVSDDGGNELTGQTFTITINQTYYDITATAGVGGSITSGGTQNIIHNSDSDPITATPDTGYHFVKWSDNNTDNPRIFTDVQENKSIEAIFSSSQHVLTYDANGGTGSASCTYGYNEKLTLNSGTGFTRTGYIIDGWKIDSVEYMLGALYTMPDNNVTALAVWVKDTDGDGFSDADEDQAGTDKTDPDSKPNDGSLSLKITNISGQGTDGVDCVLNSVPQFRVTDASGNATFADIDLFNHTLSLRIGGEQVAQYALNFENGASSSVTVVNSGASGASSGRIDVVAGSSFVGLNLDIRLNSSGYYEIYDADATLVSNPRTNDNMDLSMWILIALALLSVCIGAAFVILAAFVAHRKTNIAFVTYRKTYDRKW